MDRSGRYHDGLRAGQSSQAGFILNLLVVSMTVAYGAVMALLVQGHRLDTRLSERLMQLVKNGDLPFHAVPRENLAPPRPGDRDPPRQGRFTGNGP